jgi:thymidylate synthase
MLVNSCYQSLLRHIVDCGKLVTCRGYEIIEVLNCAISIDMNQPLVTIKARKLGKKFPMAEAAWIMSGDNRVSSISPFSRMVKSFSDDGLWYFGAYGPMVVDQLPYIIRALERDLYTRQAVLTIWRPRPYDTKDVPCTVSIQFIYREGRLHCIDNMRSSDAWLGVPYDWFNFSMLSAGVAIILNKKLNMDIKLGNLYFNAGSQHLYIDDKFYRYNGVYDVLNSHDSEVSYDPINLGEFNDYQDLVDHLWALAQGRVTGRRWLGKFYEEEV